MNRLKRICFIGFILVSIAGIISHFVYQWSGDNFILGFFFPVNESTWEHMKLAFFPMLVYSCFMSRRLQKEFHCLPSALAYGTLLATVLIPILFYTYTGVLGRNIPALDISTFFISVAVAFYSIYRLTLSCKAFPYRVFLRLLLFLFTVSFFIFTYMPPAWGIFASPV